MIVEQPRRTARGARAEQRQPCEELTQTQVARGSFTVVSQILTLHTDTAPHFIDLTERVRELVCQSGIEAGTVLVCSKHTTAAIVINEHEPLLLEDIAAMLARIIPTTLGYRHDDFSIRTVNMTPDERENGHSHCQHLLLGASCQVPIIEGQLGLGQWQRILLMELDRPRTRQVVVQASGVSCSSHART